MSFWRAKEVADESTLWRRFVQDSADLFTRAGVPAHAYESHRSFLYLLMHGYALDRRGRASSGFLVTRLNDEQRVALRALVVSYLRCGFDEPVLALFSDEVHAAILREASEGE